MGGEGAGLRAMTGAMGPMPNSGNVVRTETKNMWRPGNQVVTVWPWHDRIAGTAACSVHRGKT